jgi:hypothetical protein
VRGVQRSGVVEWWTKWSGLMGSMQNMWPSRGLSSGCVVVGSEEEWLWSDLSLVLGGLVSGHEKHISRVVAPVCTNL